MPLHKVFVYGTLKKGEPNHHWITDTSKGHAKLLGNGTTIDKYPLIIGTKYNIPFLLDAPGKGHNVAGEVYEVDDGMLMHLDVLEDHPSFYKRQLRSVNLIGSEEITCWIYLLQNFKPDLLSYDLLSDYRSAGSHERPYTERYLREPSYDYKNDILLSS
ncbi:putative gamma-glutamylcyclotransferase [Blattella germanica]|nr:putative gamma-glutamylcyclotransferase [Blattella germanica]